MPRPTDMHIPMATDGVSGLDTIPQAPLVEGYESAREVTESASGVSPEAKRLSGIRTGELPSSPALGASPTAGSLNRRFPVSPATPRASWSSPMASPSSPLAASRTRQGRPKSTEFRSGREFRPLYLVQKSIHEKTPTTTTPEIEEDLPSLPSSRTSSAHPSMENLRGEAERQEYFDIQQMTPEQFRARGRRHSYSMWNDSERRISPDYLDSRSATPVPSTVQRARETDSTREKPKYEFHSPSELLQDPTTSADLADDLRDMPRSSSPLPSVVSTEHDDFMSARSGSPSPRNSPDFEKQRSRRRSRSESSMKRDTAVAAGLGLVGGAALGLAANKAFGEDDKKVEGERDSPESEDMYGVDTIPLLRVRRHLLHRRRRRPCLDQPTLRGQLPNEVQRSLLL